MNTERVHLRRVWREAPACGTGTVDPQMTDDVVEVTCGSCWRTSLFLRKSICYLPREHPAYPHRSPTRKGRRW